MTTPNNQTPPKGTETPEDRLSKKEREELARQEQEARKAEQKRKALDEADAGTGYVMAKGRALTSLRGILAEGETVGPLDFAEGLFTLWKGRGWIVKEGTKTTSKAEGEEP